MVDEICPKTEFNPPLQLGTGEYHASTVIFPCSTYPGI